MQRVSGSDARRETSLTPPGPGEGRTRPAAGSDGVDGSIPGSHGPFAFLFTDIEDSTVLWEQHPDAMGVATTELDRLVTIAAEHHGGRVVKRLGDAMDLVFETTEDAARAAVDAQRAVADASWDEVGSLRLRMAIDVGQVTERDGTLFGPVLNRLGRILSAGHGGQILASAEAAALIDTAGLALHDLGEFRLKGIGGAQRIYQVAATGDARRFPPLRVDQSGGRLARDAQTVWGYEIGEEVGVGRLGALHRGYQPSTGRDVAVRVVRPELVNDPWFVRRFEAEARIVARLDHVHLVGLRDAWRDPDGAYLVTPWMDGGSLAAALTDGPWDLGSAARLIAQVGAALVYLHERGLVHGGVIPSNVLFDADGEARLTDAWLAPRLLGGEADEGSPIADDVRDLAALLVAVLLGDVAVGPPHLPEVSELRPEVESGVDVAVARAIAADAEGDEGAVRRFLDAVLPALEAGVEVAEPVRNPYKGLAPFGESDAADFFGREELLRALIDAVAEVPFVAVVGPSGSGKSSLVRAGLVPAAHRGRLGSDRLVTDLHPGGRPFAELEAALRRIAHVRTPDLGTMLRSGPTGLRDAVDAVLPDGTSLLLVIDQFEELFALVDDEVERRAFLDALVTLAADARDRARVVVTLRADFFDRPLEYPTFGALMKRGLLPVTPLDEDGVEAAMVGPARNVGLDVESELVAELRRAVGEEPGRLPLLQFAMTELFERGEGGTLTLGTFRDAGGLTGALARRAEEVYADLTDEAQEVAHQVFLRLVALGEGTEDTRRRVPRSRLVSLEETGSVELVLERFGGGRLLSFDRDVATREPTVEVAHEALLRHWPRLRTWIDEARDDLRSHRRLRAAAQEWRESSEDDDYLLPPARMEATDAWLDGSQVALSADEQRFVDASRSRKREFDAAEAARAAHEQELERRAMRRLRTAVAALAIGSVVAVTLAGTAFVQRSQAEQQRVAADEQRAAADSERAAAERSERVATARGLASAAIAQLDVDPERAILLGIEAVNTTRDADGVVLAEAETALRRALRASHVEHRIASGASVSVATDGRIATLGKDGTLSVWTPDGRDLLLELGGMSTSPVQRGPIRAEHMVHLVDTIDFSPDGSSIVVVDDDLSGTIRDAASGEVLAELRGALARPQFSPDGRFVAALVVGDAEVGFDAARVIGIWDASSGELVTELIGHTGNVQSHDFSPGSDRVVSVSEPDGLVMWDAGTGDMLWRVRPDPEAMYGVAFHPDGDRIAAGTRVGPVLIRDADDGTLLQTFTGHGSLVRGLQFSAGGERLVTASNLSARVWDLATGEELFALRGHTGPLADAAFTPDGSGILTTGDDDATILWDIRVPGGFEYAALPTDLPPQMSLYPGFSPDGRYLATTGPDHDVVIVELDTLEVFATLEHDHPVHLVRFAGDGSVVATVSVPDFVALLEEERFGELVEVVTLWDPATGERVGGPLEPSTLSWEIDLSSDGTVIVAAHTDGTVRAVDTATGEELFAHHHDQGPAYFVAFTPDASRIVVGAQDDGFVLDAATGELVAGFEDQSHSVTDVSFLDDGRALVTDLSGSVRVRDLTTGEQIRSVIDGTSLQSAAVWGDLVALGLDTGLSVRDLGSGERRFDVEYAATPWRVRFNADGRYLFSAFAGPWVHLHVVQTEDLLDLAHERLTRRWTDEECEEFLQRDCPEPVG